MKKFKVDGIHCGGCANRLKKGVADSFGEVEVDVAEKIVTVNADGREKEFADALKELGFEVKEELK